MIIPPKMTFQQTEMNRISPVIFMFTAALPPCVIMGSGHANQLATDIKKRLGFKAVGRKIKSIGDGFQVREEVKPYIDDFDAENIKIAPKNTYNWDIFSEISDC